MQLTPRKQAANRQPNYFRRRDRPIKDEQNFARSSRREQWLRKTVDAGEEACSGSSQQEARQRRSAVEHWRQYQFGRWFESSRRKYHTALLQLHQRPARMLCQIGVFIL